MTDREWRNHVHEMIRQHQIHSVRVCVQDASNVARSRYVTAHQFLEQLEAGGFSFPSALFGFNVGAELVPGVGSEFREGFPSWRLVPDLGTFSVLPYAPGIARIIGDVYTLSHYPVLYAPRHVLRRILARISERGWRIRGSYEYEFYVFRKTDTGAWAPAWDGLQCFSETKQAEVEDLILSIVSALQEMGAGPEIANTEYGSGQFEVSNAPFWDIEIADMAFYYRSSIKEVLAKAGYRACFMSKPRSNMSGSGAHLHHSLFDHEGHNLFWDPEKPDGLSDLCRWFIGGQLEHASALAALACGTVNSYKRLQPHSFAPTTATWGYENRATMLRVPHFRGDNTRIENRLPGADADPYLTLAGIIAAGMDGIDKRIEPPPPVSNEDAYGAQFAQLPRTPEEGLRILRKDPWLREVLGSETIEALWALRYSDYTRFLSHVTDWELATYQDLF
jgi:glutamine synthetase